MRYALLIYGNDATAGQETPAEQQALMAAYVAFGERFKDAITAGEALVPSASATTVRVRDGKRLTTDGPFAETKEQLGGYYIVNCANLDEAIEIASHIPAATDGSIEVRPVMEFD